MDIQPPARLVVGQLLKAGFQRRARHNQVLPCRVQRFRLRRGVAVQRRGVVHERGYLRPVIRQRASHGRGLGPRLRRQREHKPHPGDELQLAGGRVVHHRMQREEGDRIPFQPLHAGRHGAGGGKRSGRVVNPRIGRHRLGAGPSRGEQAGAMGNLDRPAQQFRRRGFDVEAHQAVSRGEEHPSGEHRQHGLAGLQRVRATGDPDVHPAVRVPLQPWPLEAVFKHEFLRGRRNHQQRQADPNSQLPVHEFTSPIVHALILCQHPFPAHHISWRIQKHNIIFNIYSTFL